MTRKPVAGLLQQLEAGGRQLAWNTLLVALDQRAARQAELPSPPARLCSLLQVLLDAGRPLVLYLDNLESLQRGPKSGDPDEFAAWRDRACATLWQGLLDLLGRYPGRLAVLASSRYRNRDFGAVVPFRRLPDDALWRLLRWFPNLRRLSEESRGGWSAGSPAIRAPSSSPRR